MLEQHLSIQDEILDFLISGPTPYQIISFHASVQAQEQLRELLEKNRNGSLSLQERQKLDEMSQIDHFFTLIKARAMKAVKNREVAQSE